MLGHEADRHDRLDSDVPSPAEKHFKGDELSRYEP